MIRKLNLLSVLFSFSFLIFAGNMIDDGSFELGIDKAMTGNLFKWKKGDAFDGSHYAVLRGENAFFRSKKITNISLKYTFSVYMRSPQNGAKAILKMGEGRWKAEGKRVSLTPQWKRYSLSAELKPYKANDYLGKNNIYGCWIENPGNAVIDVDCAQWEKGNLTQYKSKNKAEVGLSSKKYANVFFDNEELRFTVGVVNPNGKKDDFSCRITVSDALGDQIFKEQIAFNELDKCALKDFAFKAPQYGFFKLKAVLCDSTGKEFDKHEIHAARVASMKSDKFHPDSFFGVTARPNSTDPEIMKKQWNLVIGTGAKWNRIFINWRTVEPRKGECKWNAFFKDQTIKKGYINKMCQMLVLSGFFHRGTPKWALDEKATKEAGFDVPNEKEMLDFVTRTILRYKKEVNIWEIQNEPYLMVDSGGVNLSDASKKKFLEWIFKLQKKLYLLFKKLDPEALVIANVNGKGQLEKSQIYFNTMLEKGMMNFIDGISWHFYRGKFPPELSNEIPRIMRQARKEISEKARRKMPLNFYQTESSTCSNDLFDDENNHYGEYRQMMSDNSFGYNKSELDAAANAVRASIIEISEGVKISFWFIVGSYSDYKSYNLHSMIKDNWRSPKIIYPAHNAMARMIDETKPLGQLRLTEKLRAYAFEKGNEAVIPYWHLMFGKEQGKLSIAVDAPVKRIYDFMGNDCGFEKSSSNILIPLGKAPSYLVCDVSDISKIEEAMKSGKLLDFRGKTVVSATIASGSGMPDVATMVCNNSSDDISGLVRVAKTPQGFELAKDKAGFSRIPGMGSAVRKYPVRSCKTVDKGKITGIAMTGGKMIEFKRDAAIFVSDHAASEINVDGKADDWNLKNAPIEMNSSSYILNPAERDGNLWKGSADLSTKIWSCWDKNNLYFFIKTKDDAVVQDLDKPFMGDCVQLFFDCDTIGDMKTVHFNEDDIQFCIIPHDGKNSPSFSVISKNKTIPKEKIKIASARSKSGYNIEISLPAETLLQKSFEPGTALGFNAAVDDRDEKGKNLRRKYEMIWTGKDNKMWSFTDRLGYLILINRGEK